MKLAIRFHILDKADFVSLHSTVFSKQYLRASHVAIALLLDHYYLEYSDYWLHLYCYNHNVLVDIPSAPFRCFMSNPGVLTESRTEPFIWTTGVDFSNSVNRDRVQVLSYCKNSLLGRNAVIITIKMRSIVRIFYVIIIKLHLRNLDK